MPIVDTPKEAPAKVEQPVLPASKYFPCTDCNEEFEFTGGEQVFYSDRGLATPKRCAKCRLKRRMAVQGKIQIDDGKLRR